MIREIPFLQATLQGHLLLLYSPSFLSKWHWTDFEALSNSTSWQGGVKTSKNKTKKIHGDEEKARLVEELGQYLQKEKKRFSYSQNITTITVFKVTSSLHRAGSNAVNQPCAGSLSSLWIQREAQNQSNIYPLGLGGWSTQLPVGSKGPLGKMGSLLY